MPVYGYQRAVVDSRFGLLELREVSFAFDPAGLRRVAAFLLHYAERMESGDWKSDHVHLESFDRDWKRDHPETDLIICRR